MKKHLASLLFTIFFISGCQTTAAPIDAESIKKTAEVYVGTYVAQTATKEFELNRPTETKDPSIIGTYYDNYAPSLPYTLILKNVGGTYFKTEIYSDNSQQTIKLVANFVNGEERLVEDGNDGYFGDYMVVESNGDIAFYDKKGFIYRLHPK